MAAQKVPVVQCATQAAAKLRETTAVNKEGVLVLALKVSQINLCVQKHTQKKQKTKKKQKLASCHSICFCNNLYVLFYELRNAWADGMFTWVFDPLCPCKYSLNVSQGLSLRDRVIITL